MDVVGRPHEQMDAQTEERGRARAEWYTREETTKLAGRAAGQTTLLSIHLWVRVGQSERTERIVELISGG
jgi:hypothetical protein